MRTRFRLAGALTCLALGLLMVVGVAGPAAGQEQGKGKKPNILVYGDDAS